MPSDDTEYATRTTRTEYDYTTTDRDEVDIPEWAEEYEVGDKIHWEHDEVDGVKSSEVVGFSTLYSVGYPVIEPPREYIDGDDRANTIAVTEKTAIKLVNNEQ